MGSTEASLYDYHYFNFIYSHIPEERRGFHRLPANIVSKMIKNLIEQFYDELLKLVISEKSRLAFQVFGVFLMRHGAKMTNEVKEFILKHSRWEDEEDQLLNPQDKSERFFYL